MFLLSSFSNPRAEGSLLEQAPGDLLIDIACALESRADVLSLALTSSYVYANLVSVLYAKVTLIGTEQCTRTLKMLQRRPDISCHVRELVVVSDSTNSDLGVAAVSSCVSAAVRDAAATKRLDALTKFIWDSDEKPYNDGMWFALRYRLLGLITLQLFDFVDLVGFSLTLKHGFYDLHMDMFLDEEDASSRQMWDMLIHRCPNLEELIVEGVSTLPTDVHALVEGRWPKLRKLALGDVSIDWIPGLVDQGAKRPFITFLEAHPTLDSLSLSRYTIQPVHLATIDPGALQITSFSGTLQQLQALPYLRPHLKSVTFRDPMQTREISAQAVASLLQGLISLTDLKISFNLHSMYDSGNLLRSLISSCPHLRNLELTCGNQPSFQIDAFSKTVRGFPKLRTLSLTIVKYPGDEPLSAGAARIARANPQLTNFSLTFIPPTYPLPLPFSLFSVFSLPHFPYLPFPLRTEATATGAFELTTDHHGLPLTLMGFEHFRIIWPWGLGSSSSSRRSTRDLRPPGAPGRRKKGWRGVAGLLVERSAAGEEMRMILFCGLLVSLAVWGFASDSDKGELVKAVRSPTMQGVVRATLTTAALRVLATA
ncbi:hypothetical protein DXG03_001138 [Asterophora parasitica]|uniref:Uncharacterized protein n=1 Tax=Asterophora parasitica TaxID=117018 RepID=A0A9P7GCP9_9AGAR|nr:hypothetical protein DXG03_001138 [Asterophora parasitica]